MLVGSGVISAAVPPSSAGRMPLAAPLARHASVSSSIARAETCARSTGTISAVDAPLVVAWSSPSRIASLSGTPWSSIASAPAARASSRANGSGETRIVRPMLRALRSAASVRTRRRAESSIRSCSLRALSMRRLESATLRKGRIAVITQRRSQPARGVAQG